MPTPELDTDILIVGAGPVGLFLANECARRGLRYQIVEARATQSEHSKALAIFPRTMEIFDMAGLVAPFVSAANRVTSLAVSSHGQTIARMPFTPEETPYSYVAMVPQNETEAMLASALAQKGGKVAYETAFVSARQSGDRVHAVLEHGGAQQQVSAAFVVGCDGAHSTVRHLLGLPFEGAAYPYLFMLADIEHNHAFPADELLLCPHEKGPLAIFPISEERCRIVATIPMAEGEAPSLALTQRLLDERIPVGIKARSLYWSSYFNIHHRHVPRLRDGRIFLAGDAAHIHSPFGGQGMNTGLHDAWNLIWKLDLYLRGFGNEALLDSYSEERLPVIKQVVALTDAMTRGMSMPNRFVQGVRDTVIPLLAHLEAFRHGFVQTLSEEGIAYPRSPLIEGKGERYFDDTMRGGNGIASRFILRLGDALPGDAARTLEALAAVNAPTVSLRRGEGAGVLLIRPDGYAAYEAERYDQTVVKSVESLLRRQTSS